MNAKVILNRFVSRVFEEDERDMASPHAICKRCIGNRSDRFVLSSSDQRSPTLSMRLAMLRMAKLRGATSPRSTSQVQGAKTARGKSGVRLAILADRQVRFRTKIDGTPLEQGPDPTAIHRN